MINTGKLKGRMVEMGITQKCLAIELKLATPTVSQKLNGVRPLNLDEAKRISDILEIPSRDFTSYFFK